MSAVLGYDSGWAIWFGIDDTPLKSTELFGIESWSHLDADQRFIDRDIGGSQTNNIRPQRTVSSDSSILLNDWYIFYDEPVVSAAVNTNMSLPEHTAQLWIKKVSD